MEEVTVNPVSGFNCIGAIKRNGREGASGPLPLSEKKERLYRKGLNAIFWWVLSLWLKWGFLTSSTPSLRPTCFEGLNDNLLYLRSSQYLLLWKLTAEHVSSIFSLHANTKSQPEKLREKHLGFSRVFSTAYALYILNHYYNNFINIVFLFIYCKYDFFLIL